MNKGLLLIGIIAVGYGVFGMFYYFPSLEYIDRPFPLEHSTGITPNSNGNGYSGIAYADPLISAKADPYWIVWSASLYFGIVSLMVFGFRNVLHWNASR